MLAGGAAGDATELVDVELVGVETGVGKGVGVGAALGVGDAHELAAAGCVVNVVPFDRRTPFGSIPTIFTPPPMSDPTPSTAPPG